MTLEFELYPFVNGGETFDQFNVEFHLLRKKHVVAGCECDKTFLEIFEIISSSQICWL
jgi:hypothetical protein